MTRNEFIQMLKKEGSSIPTLEINNLVSYYQEILDEENILDSDEIPEKYNPKKIIEEFKKSNNFNEINFDYKGTNRKTIKRLLIIILLILALPILLPAFIAILVVLIMAIIGVIIAFSSLFFIAYSFKMLLIGVVLFSTGMFILLSKFIISLSKFIISHLK